VHRTLVRRSSVEAVVRALASHGGAKGKSTWVVKNNSHNNRDKHPLTEKLTPFHSHPSVLRCGRLWAKRRQRRHGERQTNVVTKR